MTYDPRLHHRRSIRLRGYDYSQANPYFVTLCTQHNLSLFGEVLDSEMHLNDAGLMVEEWWNELGHKFPGTLTDSLRIMPNHLHAVFAILGSGLDMAALFGIGFDDLDFDRAEKNEGIVSSLARVRSGHGGHAGPPLQNVDGDVVANPSPPTRPTLGHMMQWFKTMTTNAYIGGVRNLEWKPFPGKLWQRDYYEHIVRDEESLNRIREYIRDNPARWHLDRENLDRIGDDEFDEWLDEFSFES
jgi:putative transposase